MDLKTSKLYIGRRIDFLNYQNVKIAWRYKANIFKSATNAQIFLQIVVQLSKGSIIFEA